MREQEKSKDSNIVFGGGDLKKRLEEFGSKVRKKCMRKRNISSAESSLAETTLSEESKVAGIPISPKFVETMYLGSHEEQIKRVKIIRKLLSTPQPPIEDVIQAGLLPILVALLKSQSDFMQYEASWSLTNILSGSSLHVRYVIEAGAVDLFVKLLSSKNEDVQEQCAWALGNIACDKDDFRAYILEMGAMLSLLNAMKNTASTKLLRIFAWAVCNLCANNPDFQSISPAIPVMNSFLSHEDMEFIFSCCMALAYLSGGKERIGRFIDHGVVPSLIKLVLRDKELLTNPLLQIFCNLSLGTKGQIDYLIRYDILSPLQRHLDSRTESHRYKSCFVVANMALGGVEHIEYILRSGFTFSKILSFIGSDTERVVKQAVYTLRNITNGGSEDQIVSLTSQSVISKLCKALTMVNCSIVLAALVCLDNLLDLGERKVQKEGAYNEIALTIEACRGLETIEELQSHSNKEIYHKAYEIMERYFSTEELTLTDRPKF